MSGAPLSDDFLRLVATTGSQYAPLCREMAEALIAERSRAAVLMAACEAALLDCERHGHSATGLRYMLYCALKGHGGGL